MIVVVLILAVALVGALLHASDLAITNRSLWHENRTLAERLRRLDNRRTR